MEIFIMISPINQYAIAQQALEGLEVSQETIDDLYRIAKGEITSEQAIRNVTERYKNA